MENIDPYRAPVADISPAHDDTVTFSSPFPDAARLRLGAWLIFLSLILMVISLGLSVMAGMPESQTLIKWLGAVSDIVCALVSVATLLIWRNWLHARFEFHDIDSLLTVYIVVSLACTAAGLPLIDSQSPVYYAVTFGGIFLLGISGLLLALRLKPLVERYPYMKTFRLLFIIESALLASMVLVVLAVPLIFASEWCRGLMMFHAARERQNVDASA